MTELGSVVIESDFPRMHSSFMEKSTAHRTPTSFELQLPTVASSYILKLDIELYRGYVNTGLIFHDLLNKSQNYSDFIYCGVHYFITD